ncbi:hypothetical protein [Nannocystis sp.]|uniref:hypothetical protein n=1 Tax=Nannocystis sp. TaxID=1962667 RepID=UPI002422AB61|nr:hypothetical protein [Nannocystis sp.]MBK7826698.1 hypothetical protein [Nannocystis sp.]MBK9754317.1 hypothetical protein [Nannocystis sp.]
MRLHRALLLLTVALADGACEASPPATEACEELPEEGSLCPQDGEVCAPERDSCGLYHGLRCEAGVWASFEVGTGRCSVDTDARTTDGETTGGP